MLEGSTVRVLNLRRWKWNENVSYADGLKAVAHWERGGEQCIRQTMLRYFNWSHSLLQFIICCGFFYLQKTDRNRGIQVFQPSWADSGWVLAVFWHQMTNCELGLARKLCVCQIQSEAVSKLCEKRLGVKGSFLCFFRILICFLLGVKSLLARSFRTNIFGSLHCCSYHF